MSSAHNDIEKIDDLIILAVMMSVKITASSTEMQKQWQCDSSMNNERVCDENAKQDIEDEKKLWVTHDHIFL